jgi:formylglycine-generating enzyme required for sulfatase activity
MPLNSNELDQLVHLLEPILSDSKRQRFFIEFAIHESYMAPGKTILEMFGTDNFTFNLLRHLNEECPKVLVNLLEVIKDHRPEVNISLIPYIHQIRAELATHEAKVQTTPLTDHDEQFQKVVDLNREVWTNEQLEQAQEEFDFISLLARRSQRIDEAHEAWCEFVAKYPDWRGFIKDRSQLALKLSLPQPIEWIEVVAGKVAIEPEQFGYIRKEPKTFDVSAFMISRYPISNMQFAKFIEDGGYSQRRWWTGNGWRLKERDHWNNTSRWARQLSRPTNPIDGISWLEAIAFCRWLGAKMNMPVMLPTEQQWQLAAEARMGVIAEKGNKLQATIEMSVISEWCLTDFTSGIQYVKDDRTNQHDDYYMDTYDPILTVDTKVIRSLIDISRRHWDTPDSKNQSVGFRLVRSQ